MDKSVCPEPINRNITYTLVVKVFNYSVSYSILVFLPATWSGVVCEKRLSQWDKTEFRDYQYLGQTAHWFASADTALFANHKTNRGAERGSFANAVINWLCCTTSSSGSQVCLKKGEINESGSSDQLQKGRKALID